jgi:hypothetical protein
MCLSLAWFDGLTAENRFKPVTDVADVEVGFGVRACIAAVFFAEFWRLDETFRGGAEARDIRRLDDRAGAAIEDDFG